MIIELEKLIETLLPIANAKDTLPSESLWSRIAPSPRIEQSKYENAINTMDYRSPDGNTLVQIDVDRQGAILGIEIFP
jgi:hypothetical protein